MTSVKPRPKKPAAAPLAFASRHRDHIDATKRRVAAAIRVKPQSLAETAVTLLAATAAVRISKNCSAAKADLRYPPSTVQTLQ